MTSHYYLLAGDTCCANYRQPFSENGVTSLKHCAAALYQPYSIIPVVPAHLSSLVLPSMTISLDDLMAVLSRALEEAYNTAVSVAIDDKAIFTNESSMLEEQVRLQS